MQYQLNTLRTLRVAMLGIVTLVGAGLAFGATGGSGSDAAVWKHRQLNFNYTGFTSHYTCDGLVDKVRQILLTLGARKDDLMVQATGCSHSSEVPGNFAWVKTDFHSLSLQEGNEQAQSVKARWAPVELTARRPYYMNDGECELIDRMQSLVTEGFALRDLDYRAHCVPHQIGLNDFSVRGQVLRVE